MIDLIGAGEMFGLSNETRDKIRFRVLKYKESTETMEELFERLQLKHAGEIGYECFIFGSFVVLNTLTSGYTKAGKALMAELEAQKAKLDLQLGGKLKG